MTNDLPRIGFYCYKNLRQVSVQNLISKSNFVLKKTVVLNVVHSFKAFIA